MSASLNPYIASFDADFNVEQSNNLRLTIQLALGGLSFALFDGTNNRLIGIESYQSDLLNSSDDLIRTLEKALDAKGLNHKKFQTVSCVIDERVNTLIPKALYNSDDNDKYLNFSFNQPKDWGIAVDMLEKHEAVNIFAFPNALQTKIKAKWPEATFCHSSSVFLESLPTSTNSKVWVNVRNRDFDMAIMKDKLLFFNNFKFNTKDDFAYFLLFAMEQNGLSGDDTPVCVSGLILPSSDIINLCGRYIRDIQFVKRPEELQIGETLKEVPYHYYHIHYQILGHETSGHETRVYQSRVPRQ